MFNKYYLLKKYIKKIIVLAKKKKNFYKFNLTNIFFIENLIKKN